MSEQTALQRVSEATIMPFIAPKQNDLVKLIGENNMKREFSFAVQAVNANDYMSKATPQSVAKAIWNVAITGLTLNPVHKLAYLVPKKIGENVEAVLMPSYQGLVKLLTDTGSVIKVYAHPVCKGDEFEVILGGEYTLVHKPKFLSKEITHVYGVGVLQDGTKQFEVMSITDINEIRDRSDGWKSFKAGRAKSCIWESDYSEMARKTVIRRLAKYLPKTNAWDKVSAAIELDNSEYGATINQEEYIHSLLESSTYDHEHRARLEKQVMSGISRDEAERMIEELKVNQLDPISSGRNYSQTDIKHKIGNEIMNEQRA